MKCQFSEHKYQYSVSRLYLVVISHCIIRLISLAMCNSDIFRTDYRLLRLVASSLSAEGAKTLIEAFIFVDWITTTHICMAWPMDCFSACINAECCSRMLQYVSCYNSVNRLVCYTCLSLPMTNNTTELYSSVSAASFNTYCLLPILTATGVFRN